MSVNRLPTLAILLFCALTQACANELTITVLYDHSQGLKPGDRVYMREASVGKVHSVELNADGRYAASIWIEHDYRDMVTNQCRFLIVIDSQEPNEKAIDIVCPENGGIPLAEGAIVEGSSDLSYLLELGGRELKGWTERLQEELKMWLEELRLLPEQQWYKQLERQMEVWAERLERAEEDVQRHFHQEVLPKLEESLRELRKRYEEKGKEKELEPLEKKMERLKTV